MGGTPIPFLSARSSRQCNKVHIQLPLVFFSSDFRYRPLRFLFTGSSPPSPFSPASPVAKTPFSWVTCRSASWYGATVAGCVSLSALFFMGRIRPPRPVSLLFLFELGRSDGPLPFSFLCSRSTSNHRNKVAGLYALPTPEFPFMTKRLIMLVAPFDFFSILMHFPT